MLVSVSISVFAFRNPIAIVFYIVILEIYEIYNFVAILTAFLFSTPGWYFRSFAFPTGLN